MKFKFDANQEFQIDAVNAVADLFEGQGQNVPSAMPVEGNLIGIYPNALSLTNDELFANVKKVQERNRIENGHADSLDFSIEMETGTGKTYVYLRTMYELNRRYGWKKFIILVPSVAIREGVLKTLDITKEHFAELYDRTPCWAFEYQSRNISQIKHFADSSVLTIMVMTVASFNKDANVLYGARDQMQGEQPIAFLQKTQPILILDEPQNMEGEATARALENFNALFRLRYSATHRNLYNLLYRLTPAEAYRLNLVKKIEVFSVTDDETGASRPYLNLVSVAPGKTLKAKVEALTRDTAGNYRMKRITLARGDDLATKARNGAYAGYVVEDLAAEAPEYGSTGMIRFQNGVEVRQGETIGGNHPEVLREQITQTIRLHFEKRARLREAGIKVLSLFFIDKVDNYVLNDGIIRTVFISEFLRLKGEFALDGLSVEHAHKGYFAKRGDEYLERDSSIAENQEAYELIMKDKERLLSFEEPTEFIFSHSALREGWDNPNIFNICTLRQTASPVRKRQEIGRGMRLAVDQNGDRVFTKQINVLSVIANESYSDYVRQLQEEFVEDGIIAAAPRPENARKRQVVKLKRGFEKDSDFQGIWDRISKRTRFLVRVDTERLTVLCAKRIHELRIPRLSVRVERAAVDIGEKEISGRMIGSHSEAARQTRRTIDMIGFVKNETKLTRATVAAILAEADNTEAVLNNPERFAFEASKILREELLKCYVSQVSYELLPERYAVERFENLESYKDAILPVERSIYDAIVFESDPEKRFAIELGNDERVKLFIKLPDWFKVDTPVGGYNPDWAIVTAKQDLHGHEESERIYFVIETKSDLANLRPSEQAKIDSAKKHFEVIAVEYKEVDSYAQFAERLIG